MGQNHLSGVDSTHDPLRHKVRSEALQVQWIRGPQDPRHGPRLVQHKALAMAQIAVGRAQGHRWATNGGVDRVIGAVDLMEERRVGMAVEVGVRPCVIADLVTLRDHALQNLRVARGIAPNDIKGGANASGGQHIKQLWRQAGVRPSSNIIAT